MLKTLSFGSGSSSGMGAFHFDSGRSQGRCAFFPSTCSDAGGGVRVGEEGPSQQRGGQDTESDNDCIVHGIS